MSRTSKASNALFNAMDNLTENEEMDLPNGEFTAKLGKAYKIFFIVIPVLFILPAIALQYFNQTSLAILLYVLGGLFVLLLPTVFSYKCTVNTTSITEDYFIVFIRITKEIMWADIKYKKHTKGESNSIVFYDENKKRLMSFDPATVGYSRIVQMAKRSSIKNI